jgi:hypothetical protein
MILHGFRTGSPVVTDTGCCPSAAEAPPLGHYSGDETLIVLSYRASPNEVTSHSMVDPLRRKNFTYGVVVTPFGEAL